MWPIHLSWGNNTAFTSINRKSIGLCPRGFDPSTDSIENASRFPRNGVRGLFWRAQRLTEAANTTTNDCMTNPSSRPLSFPEMLAYGMGAAGINLIWSTFGGFLTYFYTDVFGISVQAMATIFLATRIYDIFADLAMGAIADRTRSRWGKFRPWILWMALPLGICAALAFSAPGFGATGKVVYAFFTYMLMMTAYTAYAIPHNSLQGVMTDDPDGRTRIASVMNACGPLGGLASVGLCLPLVAFFGKGDEAKGFLYTIGLFSLMSIALFLVTFFFVQERVQPIQQKNSPIWLDFKDLLQNRPWLMVFCVGAIAALASASRVSVMVHYFKYNLGNKDLVTVVRSIGTVATLLGAVATPMAGRWIGKAKALGVSILIVGLSCALMFFSAPDRLWVVYATFIPAEFFGGIVITLFFAMLGDTADYSEWMHGRRATGIIYSAGSVALKTGFAFGGVIMSWTLSSFGYVANMEQSPQSLFGIALAATIIPGVLFCLAAVPAFLYPLTGEKLNQIKCELERRRQQLRSATAEQHGAPQ